MDDKVAAARGIVYDSEDWTDAGPSWYDKAKAWVVIKVYSASQILAHL